MYRRLLQCKHDTGGQGRSRLNSPCTLETDIFAATPTAFDGFVPPMKPAVLYPLCHCQHVAVVTSPTHATFTTPQNL